MADFLGISLDDLASSFKPKVGDDPMMKSLSALQKRRADAFHTEPIPKRPRRKVLKFQTFELTTGQGCLHEVVYPMGQTLQSLKPVSEPARKFPFTLDSFQQEAIVCIENDQSVLVSAHTSAGKTVVAEYAIAKSLTNKQRVIYTTPIKALSNQKFREFTEIFKDVGLMTGDITINPEATVLIMTTEILRSMLYRGSDVTREVGWVIFDEIHYLQEKERGVVWEETIILLPDSVGLVFLSATIPNARQFAEWIVHLHKRPCHVVYTDYRPVPLQHYVFPCGGDGIHLVVNQQVRRYDIINHMTGPTHNQWYFEHRKREFLESNFNNALTILQNAAGNAAADTQMKGRKGGSTRLRPYCSQLVKLVMDNNLEPLIVFSFSKKDCEFYAMQLKKMDFNTDTEKAAVDLIFNNAIDSLSTEDKKLPQIQILLPVLRRGIGIHHGGLLPILKEIVEILFGEGLIKVLFATETFAMGLNMPARTVLFTATRKFDGRDFRLVLPGEYIQMSGRAGRRGKDDRGTVILMLDDRISTTEARQLLLGEPGRLNSAFYLSNNMVLNLLRIDDIHPEIMLEKSFLQFQHLRSLPSIDERLATLESDLEAIELPADVDASQLRAYVQMRQALDATQRRRWAVVTSARAMIPFLQCGRVVRVHSDDIDYGWAVVLHIRQSHNSRRGKACQPGTRVDCLLQVASGSAVPEIAGKHQPLSLAMVEPCNGVDSFAPDQSDKATAAPPCQPGVQWVSVPLTCIAEVSSVCLKVPSSLGPVNRTELYGQRLAAQSEATRRNLWEGIERARTKLGDHLPLLDPVEDMHVEEEQMKKITEAMHVLEARIKLSPLAGRPDIDQLVDLFNRRAAKLMDLDALRQQQQRSDSLLQHDELFARKRLLRRLGFCQDDDVIGFKGRIACEISSGEELMLTELMLDGFFSPLSPPQLAGALSCFVVDAQSGNKNVDLLPDMKQALTTIQNKARFLARIANECRVSSLLKQASLTSAPSQSSGLRPAGPTSTTGADPPASAGGIPEAGGLLNSRASELDDEQAYVDRFSGDLMEVTRAWAQGVSFARLCEITEVYEGSVIRCMRRLEELLRQLHDAAKVAGNSDLENKFAQTDKSSAMMCVVLALRWRLEVEVNRNPYRRATTQSGHKSITP